MEIPLATGHIVGNGLGANAESGVGVGMGADATGKLATHSGVA